MKVVIIDDEADGRWILEDMLKKLSDIQVVGQADSINSAYKLILETKPELVFLDVEMSGEYGFDLLERFEKIDFHIVFVTAHDQYAIKAIKFSALDYLLKPIDPEELQEAVERARQPVSEDRITQLLNNLKVPDHSQKLVIQSVSSIKYVEIREIVRFQAEGSYTNIFLRNGEKIVSTKILKEFEEILADGSFLRVHRSHLIRLTCVKEFLKVGKDRIIMTDGVEIEVSRKKKAEFLEAMSKL